MDKTDLDALGDPKKAILAGAVITACFVLGFLSWAATAPLAGAAIAPGRVVPEGERKTVQHLDGGIIAAIAVQEGSRVEAGDMLFRLDATQLTAVHQAVRHRWQARKATEARLMAEEAGAGDITFPPALVATGDEPAVAVLLEDERKRLASRQALYRSQRAVLEHRRERALAERAALDAALVAGAAQLALLAEEKVGVEQLLAKGLERRPRLLALQRAEAQLEGRQAADRAAREGVEQAIAEAKQELERLADAQQDEIRADLLRVRAELAQLDEEVRASAERLARTVISAPVAGTVVALAKHTVGGVIAPGERLLDLVPAEAALVVEARVNPLDIDEVHPELEAKLHLSAFKARHLPPVVGRVRTVSADRLIEPLTGEPYFAALVEIDPRQLPKGVALAAGMPVETIIVTAERTLLDYLVEPIETVLRRGLKES